ncbi:MAG: hypothetical protein LBP59_16725 [Planctomycetaceae bacterium]|nr:hypothetical protein [Planctomycetaceae bacterium]
MQARRPRSGGTGVPPANLTKHRRGACVPLICPILSLKKSLLICVLFFKRSTGYADYKDYLKIIPNVAFRIPNLTKTALVLFGVNLYS